MDFWQREYLKDQEAEKKLVKAIDEADAASRLSKKPSKKHAL